MSIPSWLQCWLTPDNGTDSQHCQSLLICHPWARPAPLSFVIERSQVAQWWKNLPANAGDAGSIPRSSRPLGGGNGNLFQDSCLENPMDRGAWWATVYRAAKSRTGLSDWARGCLANFSRILSRGCSVLEELHFVLAIDLLFSKRKWSGSKYHYRQNCDLLQ